MGIGALISIGARICYVVAVPIVFHRVNMTWDLTDANINVIKDQEYFAPIATQCGDLLTVMNTTQANDQMQTAFADVQKSWAFSCFGVVLICAEPAVLIIGALLWWCKENVCDRSSSYYRPY